MPTYSGRGERGVALIFAIFATCAFSVLAVASLTTTLALAPSGTTYDIFHYIMRVDDGHFNAPLRIPVDWQTALPANAGGLTELNAPFLERPQAKMELTPSSWAFAIAIAPGVNVCCDGDDGQCGRRTGAAADWLPDNQNSRQLSFDLATQAAAASASDPTSGSDVITATIRTASVRSGGPVAGSGEQSSGPLSCRLEVQGTVVAKAAVNLEQIRRPGTDGAGTEHIVHGGMDLAVRTK